MLRCGHFEISHHFQTEDPAFSVRAGPCKFHSRSWPSGRLHGRALVFFCPFNPGCDLILGMAAGMSRGASFCEELPPNLSTGEIPAWLLVRRLAGQPPAPPPPAAQVCRQEQTVLSLGDPVPAPA